MPEYRANDPNAIAKATRAQEDLDADLDAVLATERGRRFLHELVYGTCHVGQPSFVSEAPTATAFNEGARSVGEALLGKIRERSPKMFMKMHEEHHFNG